MTGAALSQNMPGLRLPHAKAKLTKVITPYKTVMATSNFGVFDSYLLDKNQNLL